MTVMTKAMVSRNLTFAMVMLLLATLENPLSAAPLQATKEQVNAIEKLGNELPDARLLWVNDHKIYHSTLTHWNPQQVTGQGAQEYRPRWSQDGKKILFQRGDSVFIMDEDFSNQEEVIRGGHTADWTGDGDGITAIAADGYRVLYYRLADSKLSVLYDSRTSGYDGQQIHQGAVLRVGGRYLVTFRREPTHASFIVDLQKRQYLANPQMLRGDCKPTWSPKGEFLLTTARTSDRPILQTTFSGDDARLGASEVLVTMDKGLRYYMHDGQVSNDGKWLVFGGKVLLGPSMLGRREIYIWRFGSKPNEITRLTFDTNDDDTPSLYVPDSG